MGLHIRILKRRSLGQPVKARAFGMTPLGKRRKSRYA
jgi:hypothetical protein